MPLTKFWKDVLNSKMQLAKPIVRWFYHHLSNVLGHELYPLSVLDCQLAITGSSDIGFTGRNLSNNAFH